MYRRPEAFYVDPGQQFDNEILRTFLREERVAIDYAPSGSSESTEIMEIYNRLLKHVLCRTSGTSKD